MAPRAEWGGLASRLLLFSAAAVAAYLLVGRLPATGSAKVDATLGFLLALAPVAWLAWTLLASPPRPWLLGLLTIVPLAFGLLLSGGGWIGIAAPFKVVAAVALGYLLGLQLDRVWLLVLVAALAFVADIWSVFAGPTRVIVQRAPGALEYALVHFPELGTGRSGVALGMSDLVFLALFTIGSREHGLRPRASFAAMVGSLLVTLAVTLVLERALPALPLIAVAFLLANADRLVRRRLRVPG